MPSKYPLVDMGSVDIGQRVRYWQEDGKVRELAAFDMARQFDAEMERRKDVQWQRGAALFQLKTAQDALDRQLKEDEAQNTGIYGWFKGQGVELPKGLTSKMSGQVFDSYFSNLQKAKEERRLKAMGGGAGGAGTEGFGKVQDLILDAQKINQGLGNAVEITNKYGTELNNPQLFALGDGPKKLDSLKYDYANAWLTDEERENLAVYIDGYFNFRTNDAIKNARSMLRVNPLVQENPLPIISKDDDSGTERLTRAKTDFDAKILGYKARRQELAPAYDAYQAARSNRPLKPGEVEADPTARMLQEIADLDGVIHAAPAWHAAVDKMAASVPVAVDPIDVAKASLVERAQALKDSGVTDKEARASIKSDLRGKHIVDPATGEETKVRYDEKWIGDAVKQVYAAKGEAPSKPDADAAVARLRASAKSGIAGEKLAAEVAKEAAALGITFDEMRALAKGE